MQLRTAYDPIALGVQWDRLISIADEIVSTLVRASFSTNVRESYDLSCVIFDAAGRALAQGRYSVPSFTGTAQMTLQHLLAAHPAATLRPGDVLMTNDPWLGTGHLFDINVAQPIWRGGAIVGYVMSITHLPDIGGIGFSATAREIYEEGLRLPPVKFIREGVVDPILRIIIESNVRVAQQTMGDIMANVACTIAGGRMVNELMDEYRVEDLTPLADAILDSSEASLRQALRAAPEGVYVNRIDVEGVHDALALACKVTIRDGRAHVDLAGSSPSVEAAINVPFCYSRAMALHAIKCLMTPSIPNNEGSARPISVSAPEGCVLNAVPPSATGGRHIIGHFIQPLIFGALAKALPENVQADSGMLNLINVQGRNRRGEGVSSIFFASGGFGALEGIDGASTTPSPSNMTSTPVEVWEDITGLRIISKTLLADSGGAGEFRGGLGQRIEMINDTEFPMTMSCLAGRTDFPPLGMLGGKSGARRRVEINGAEVHPKGRYVLAPRDTIIVYEAGGGGYGDPALRDQTAIRRDIDEGFVLRPAFELEARNLLTKRGSQAG